MVAANAAAGERGVRPGLGLASALALAPDILVRPRHEPLETATLREVAACASGFTPQVSLDPPDCVLLEVSRSLRLFGGAAKLAQRLRRGCRELGLEAVVAGAPTPLAARWLARSGSSALLRDPAGIAQALAPLEVDWLDCAAPLLELLRAVGIRRIGQCFALPRAGLARRQAQQLGDLLDRALGRIPDPRPEFVPPPVFRSRIELLVPAAQAEALTLIARRLLAALAGHLAARHCGVEHFRLRLEHEDAAATELAISLGTLSRDEARFTLLAREHLGVLQIPEPVSALALEAEEILPFGRPSGDLFGDPAQGAEERSLLVQRLRARLGREAVRDIAPRADHRPERAWQALESDGERRPRKKGEASCSESRPRPLWLLPEPRRIALHSAAPFARGPLTLLAGPERIESGWWDDQPVARDYYVAASRAGQLLWVFREHGGEEGWYVQGIFA